MCMCVCACVCAREEEVADMGTDLVYAMGLWVIFQDLCL